MGVTRGPLYRGAVRARRFHMAEARHCKEGYAQTGDPVYLELVRLNVRMARAFNRHAWRGK